jgi:hypothetical protein
MGFPDPLSGPDIYVEPPAVPGDDLVGSGSQADPFNSVQAGIAKAKDGGIVHVHGGHYIESVRLDGIKGKSWRPIIVRPFGDGEVCIDAIRPEFLVPGGDGGHWVEIPRSQGVEGEFVWSKRFERTGGAATGRVNLGAFLDRPQHTRLVTYGRVEDLRAVNQQWPESPNSGDNRVWRKNPNDDQPNTYIPEKRLKFVKFRPWVYMGPGTWFDEDDRPAALDDVGGRLIHIRLAPTSNQIPDWPDYIGETDANELELALSIDDSHAIFLKNASHLRFENLTLRFGNPDTVRLTNCFNIVLDHVRIRSGSRAIRLQTDEPSDKNTHITVAHCEIDGGTPTWFFRSDRKDGYIFGPHDKEIAPESEVKTNNLGSATSGAQISSGPRTSNVTVHHCEIINAHDSYVFGDQMEFHHNWVHNLNDDGIALAPDEAQARDAKIYCNVMTQCLTAVSFAHGPVKQVWLYGNLIDIREPTLGRRPTGDGTPDSLRQGHFFKDGFGEGPIDLFHNTILVLDPGAKGDVDLDDLTRAGFGYYATIGDSEPRHAFNNILVAVYSQAAGIRPIAFLPPDTFECSTDGNTYFRIPEGKADSIKFIVRRKFADSTPPENEDFIDLEAYRKHYWPPAEGQTPYEKEGKLEDPAFKSFDTTQGRPRRQDDLRLRPETLSQPGSPAKGTAVEMPKLLRDLYFKATGTVSQDRGCYPATGPRLQVGVDGRKMFPRMRPGPDVDTHPDDPPVVREIG